MLMITGLPFAHVSAMRAKILALTLNVVCMLRNASVTNVSSQISSSMRKKIKGVYVSGVHQQMNTSVEGVTKRVSRKNKLAYTLV